MLKYLAKISMDIFPSVLATIIGAYIVNHYINAKPAADTPAAVVAPAEAGKDAKPTDTANLPAPGVKAKGVSEKSVTDKAAAEKPADKPETKAADVAPADAASHGRPAAREKAAAKSTPAATASVVEANSAPAAASPAATPDANDLARAAIERLRKSPEGKAAEAKAAEAKAAEAKAAETRPAERTPEPAVREATRVPEAPRVVTTEPSAVRPLPPPITVSTPSPEAYGNAGSQPSYTASVGNDDPNRITPPADIPVPVIAPPLDLRADVGATMPRPKKTNVADEMLSGMKSMFHSVLPKSSTPD
ncbi:chemotaxis protein histidine kinase CheA [Bradyrhizobium sp. USDA 377]